MIYGYIRVSTKEQDTDKQKFEIFNYAHYKGLKTDEIIEETISSKRSYKNRLLGQLSILLSSNSNPGAGIVWTVSAFHNKSAVAN